MNKKECIQPLETSNSPASSLRIFRKWKKKNLDSNIRANTSNSNIFTTYKMRKKKNFDWNFLFGCRERENKRKEMEIHTGEEKHKKFSAKRKHVTVRQCEQEGTPFISVLYL